MHPNRLRFAVFSDQNPMMQPVKALAESVRAARQPVSADNPLLAMERAASSWITSCLETYGEFRDTMTETVFLNTYGSPVLQALVGLGVAAGGAAPHRARPGPEAREAQLRAELEQRFEVGGLEEAVLRALVYIRLPEGSIDERGFAVLKHDPRVASGGQADEPGALQGDAAGAVPARLASTKKRAVAALPKLLGADAAARKAALDVLHRVLAARGDLSDEGKRRLARDRGDCSMRGRRKPVKAEAAHA